VVVGGGGGSGVEGWGWGVGGGGCVNMYSTCRSRR